LRIPCDILVPPKAFARQVRVPVFFSCFQLGIGAWLYFLVDTGAGRSLLSERDAKILGIDYLKLELQNDPLIGLGTSPVFRIKEECKLTFLDSERKSHIETLPNFDVMKVKIEDIEKRVLVFNLIPSLIGMEILQKFKFVVTNKEAYLEW
jgi:predicted aspartyl protease